MHEGTSSHATPSLSLSKPWGSSSGPPAAMKKSCASSWHVKASQFTSTNGGVSGGGVGGLGVTGGMIGGVTGGVVGGVTGGGVATGVFVGADVGLPDGGAVGAGVKVSSVSSPLGRGQ